MTFFKPDDLARVTGGRWLDAPPNTAPLTGIDIDTRRPLAGGAYVAVRGATHDGHAFAAEAARRGAAVVLVERPVDADTAARLLIDDARAALSRLAAHWRDQLTDTHVIAVTGSAGKTTTKDLLGAVLASLGPVATSPRSFNNDIGVPLTLLAARRTDAAVVVEVGTSNRGEIDALARIVRPDAAVVTLIAEGHLEGIGTLADVADEKLALLGHLRTGGVAVLRDDMFTRAHCAAHPELHAIRFGPGAGAGADAHLAQRGGGEHPTDPSWFEVGSAEPPRQRFTSPLPGQHNALNALAALLVARHLGVPDAAIAEAFKTATPPASRLSRIDCGGVVLLDDAYNANPASMRAALDTFAEMSEGIEAVGGRRVLVLGDMLELGEQSQQFHCELAASIEQATQNAPDDGRPPLVLLLGDAMAHTAQALADRPGEQITVHALGPATDDACARAAALLQHGDVVLLKASRGVALERVITAVRERSTISSTVSV